MGSTVYYNSARIEPMIDSILLVLLRIFIVVFFALVSVLAFVFAVSMAGVCLAALGLRLMLRFVCTRQETQRLFALAGC